MEKNKSNRRYEGQKRNGGGAAFPYTPSEHLQMICDLQTFRRRRTKEEILKGWKLGTGQCWYRGSCFWTKKYLLTLMSDALEILHMDHKGLADSPMRGMGFCFAVYASIILRAEILSPIEIQVIIRQINTEYGINLNYEWWVALLDNYEVSREDVRKFEDHVHEGRSNRCA